MSNKENFEINNNITFTGKKDLEELIADYKDLRKELGNNDKAVNELYEKFEGMASIVNEINKDLKATPSDAFKEADKNLKSAQHNAEKATKKLKYWNNELDKPNNAPRRIDEINSKIEGFQHDLEKANTEAKKFGGKKGWLVQQHKDVDISGPVKDYEERVSQLLPKMDLIVLKLLDIKNEATASGEAFQEFDEGAETFTVIEDSVYNSALRLKELKQELKEAVPGTQEWKDLTQEIAKEKAVVDEYTKEVNEETAAILKASKTQEELTKESEEAEQAYSKLNPVLESYRSEIEQLTTDFGTFKQEYAANTEVLNDPHTFVMATDQINLFKNKVEEFLDQLNALSQDTSIPITFRAEFLNQVDELSSKTSELYGNILNLEAPIDRIGDMSEAHLENLVVHLADIIDADKELLQKEPSEELEATLNDNIKLATEVGKVWEEVNKDVSIFGELQKAKEEASKQEAATEEETRNLEEYSNSLLRINARLKQLRAEQAGLEKKVLVNMDTPDDSAQYDKNREEIEHLKAVKEELNATSTETVQNLQIEENENVQYSEGILGVIQRLQDLKAEKTELENLDVSERTPESGARYEEVISEIARLNAIKKDYEATLKGVTSEENKASKSRSNLTKQTKKASSAHKDLDKTLNNVKKSLKKGITMITKYVLGFRSLFFLVRKLKSEIKEGLENLVQFDSGNNKTNEAITELRTSLLYLKNAWAAAVAPILNVVIPILNMLIDAFARVGNAIGMFFAKLTGQSKVIQAVRADMGDYAKSLDKSAGSSGKASKAADKLHDRLAAFDDLNVLGVDKESDPNSSGGGGGGALDDMPSIDEMFEWADPVGEFAQKLRDAFLSGDFFGLGSIIGNKIKESLDSIDWEGIQDNLSEKITDITSFINGLFTTEGLFSSLGTTLAEGLNTAVSGIHQIIKEIDWKGILTGIGEGITSFLSEFDFGELLLTIGDGIVAALEGLSGFIDGLDIGAILDNLWEGIKTAVTEFEWSSLFKGIGSLLGESAELVVELVEWLSGVFTDLFINMHDYMWPYVEPYLEDLPEDAGFFDVGLAIFQGITDGLLDGIKDIGTWLYDNVFTPIYDGICEAFEINSPSKVMEEIGGYLIDGLLEGLKNLVSKVIEPFNDLKDKITEVWTTIKTKATLMWTMFKLGLVTIAKAIKTAVTTPFTDMKDAIVETVTTLKTKVVALWKAIWTGIKGVINSILGGIESFCNGIIDGINNVLDALDIVDDLPDTVKEYLELDSFSIPKLNHVEIPRLAQGAVIPPNKEFLAILGDQKSGTNIEAPLDTIVDAFREVMGSIQVEASNQVLQVDGQTFARLMTPYIVSELSRRGYNVKIIGG